MTDNTLCVSTWCPVAALCMRSPKCSGGYTAHGSKQSFSEFQPEKGRDCHGFIDTRAEALSDLARIDAKEVASDD
jgi:hypothetical protein